MSRIITGRRCAVLGDPVAHSLSPALHRAGYTELGLDWHYDARRVPEGSLARFVTALDGDWRGLSVTAPLKREAMALADRVTTYAELTGAVNTLVLEPDAVVGHNTDLPGAMAAVRERTDASVRRVLLLGGGATAASLGLALCELGASELTLAVREPARATTTRATLAAHGSGPQVGTARLDDLGAVLDRGVPDVIVSTVPADVQTPALVTALRAAPVLFEAVYDPWPTPLVAAAEGVVVSGLDLLIHQAALQFELFTGVPVPVSVLRAAGERALAVRSER